jgi:cytochrome o ubiquinol oxidase subunit 2
MPKSKKQHKLAPILALLGVVAFGLILAYLLKGTNVALFNPHGMVADEQHRLLVISTLIMLGFGLPVILTIYFFAWKYREGAQRSAAPATEMTKSKALLLFARGGTLITVLVLISLMLPATHRLQPQKTIETNNKPITIQVVSLDWKWLFIYPDQDIASVNFTQFPVNTPVRFMLTADEAPMSSFWIPNLGGMLYTMTGHVNELNLIGRTIGDYPGKTAEINGKGFADMKFTARVSSQKDFDAWVAQKQRTFPSLTEEEYQKLLKPSENNKPAFYSHPAPDLFNTIVSKYNPDMHMMNMETTE